MAAERNPVLSCNRECEWLWLVQACPTIGWRPGAGFAPPTAREQCGRSALAAHDESDEASVTWQARLTDFVSLDVRSSHRQQSGMEREQTPSGAETGEASAATRRQTLARLEYSVRFFQGVLGSVKSGKSALVTKYITGSYVALEKPDGKRNFISTFQPSQAPLVQMTTNVNCRTMRRNPVESECLQRLRL